MSKGIVTTMFVCPRCSADISANSKPSACLSCGFKFSKIGNEGLSKEFESGSSLMTNFTSWCNKTWKGLWMSPQISSSQE